MLIADNGTVTRSISVIRVSTYSSTSKLTYIYSEYRNREGQEYMGSYPVEEHRSGSTEPKSSCTPLFEVKFVLEKLKYVLEKLKYRSCNMRQ